MRTVVRGAILSAVWFCIFSMPLGSSGVYAEEPAVNVTVNVDNKKIYIGDDVRYEITVAATADVETKPPEFTEELTEISTRDFGVKVSNLLVKKKIVYWYVFDTYTTGEHTIPAATLQYKGKKDSLWRTVTTEPVKIQVESLLKQEGVSDFSHVEVQDIEPPVSSRSLFWPITAVAILVIAAGLAVYYKFFPRKTSVLKTALSKSAHQIARERLEALKGRNLPGQGMVKEYYSELSDIVRHYIEERFAIRAAEMTTEEFLSGIEYRGELNERQKALLKEFLCASDMVKFAKYGPDNEEIERSFSAAIDFVEQTKPQEHFEEEKKTDEL